MVAGTAGCGRTPAQTAVEEGLQRTEAAGTVVFHLATTTKGRLETSIGVVNFHEQEIYRAYFQGRAPASATLFLNGPPCRYELWQFGSTQYTYVPGAPAAVAWSISRKAPFPNALGFPLAALGGQEKTTELGRRALDGAPVTEYRVAVPAATEDGQKVPAHWLYAWLDDHGRLVRASFTQAEEMGDTAGHSVLSQELTFTRFGVATKVQRPRVPST